MTHLLPELLQKVDEGQIAFTPAVHLSYLSPAEQGWVLDEMERNDCTPSVGQAYHLKEHSMAGTMTNLTSMCPPKKGFEEVISNIEMPCKKGQMVPDAHLFPVECPPEC